MLASEYHLEVTHVCSVTKCKNRSQLQTQRMKAELTAWKCLTDGFQSFNPISIIQWNELEETIKTKGGTKRKSWKNCGECSIKGTQTKLIGITGGLGATPLDSGKSRRKHVTDSASHGSTWRKSYQKAIKNPATLPTLKKNKERFNCSRKRITGNTKSAVTRQTDRHQ